MANFRRVSLALLGVTALAGCAGMPGTQQYSQAARPAPQELAPGMIQQVQARLQQQGLYNGAIDGIWGSGTQTALRSYQQSRGLSASGQIDTSTLASLNLPNNTTMSGSSSAPAPAAPAPQGN